MHAGTPGVSVGGLAPPWGWLCVLGACWLRCWVVGADEISSTEVDGVPVLWTVIPGPLRAGLTFRTGSADETLVTAGRTHLLAHLVTDVDGGSPHECGATVGETTTSLVVRGGPEDVAGLLARACSRLRSLPGARLAQHKATLVAEAEATPPSVASPLLARRFGAKGYGLSAHPELGAAQAGIEDLQSWARARLTRGNAVLWLTGPPPAGLRLELSEGAWRPPPPAEQVLSLLPAHVVADMRGAAMSALVPGSAASVLAAALAERLLLRRLREVEGLSQVAWASHRVLDGDHAHVVLYADSNPGQRRVVATALVDVVQSLASAVETDVEAERRGQHVARREMDAAAAQAAALRSLQLAASEAVLHRARVGAAEREAGLRDVDAAAVAHAGAQIRDSALYVLPPDAAPRPAVGWAAPESRHEPIRSRHVFLHRDAPVVGSRLVVSGAGVTAATPTPTGRGEATVRFDDVAALLRWDDGGLVLIGTDATRIVVEPTVWRGGEDLAHVVRGRVDRRLTVALGPREPGTVPRPSSTRVQRVRAGLRAYGRGFVPLALALVAAVTLWVALLATSHPAPAVPVAWIGAVLLLLTCWRLIGVWRGSEPLDLFVKRRR